MPVGLKVHFRDDGLDEQLADLAARVVRREPAMQEIGGELQASTHQRFRDERGPEGEAWPELAPATLIGRAGKKARTKRGGYTKRARTRMSNARILRDTGELFNSISFQANANQVSVGTNKAYARIQQLGGQAGRRGNKVEIPARPFLGISDDDRGTIADILSQHLGVR